MRGRQIFLISKPILNILVVIFKIFPYRIRASMYQMTMGIGGIPGIGIRYILIKTLLRHCGENVSIHKNVHISGFDKIDIGSNVSIHPMSYIEGAGGVSIGNDVSIAHSVTIMSTSHVFTLPSKTIKDQGIEYKRVIIGNDVWIGCKATILLGVSIGERTIIGAMSLINRDIVGCSIAAGIPAKIIKKI